MYRNVRNYLRDMAHCSHSKLVPGCIFSRMSSMPPSISSRHSSRWEMGQHKFSRIQSGNNFAAKDL